jgi:hypothetical protein
MIRLQVSCGCGFLTDYAQEAEKHSEETGHILTIDGSVSPDDGALQTKTFVRGKEELFRRAHNDHLFSLAENDSYLSTLLQRSKP